MQLQLVFQGRTTGNGKSTPFTFRKQYVDVLPGEELQPLRSGQYQAQAHHVFCQQGFFNYPGRQHPDLDITHGFNFANLDDQVLDGFRLAHQGITVGKITFLKRQGRVKGVVDLAAFKDALATAAGAVFTGIGQHHTLSQSGHQYAFPFPDLESFAAAGDGHFKLLHAFLLIWPDIFADYSPLW